MTNITKPIRLSEHAKQQLFYRGTTAEEIENTIRTTAWQTAELDRLECRKDFVYNKNWNDKCYKTKQVRPIFVEEHNEIVVITIYVYYF